MPVDSWDFERIVNVLLPYVSSLNNYLSYSLQKPALYLKNKLMYGPIIRLIIEGYLDLTISTLI